MNKINLPDEFQLLKSKYYFDSADDPEAVAYCEARNFLVEKALKGELYIKFVGGDRKGSIAKVKLDANDHPYNDRQAEIVPEHYSYRNEQRRFLISNEYFFGTAKWDKRKNSCKVDFPNKNIVFLPNYEGPTVYVMFDKKSAKEELLKNPNQRDIDGKSLNVGDKVLYINARYGSGFAMCHGTIKEFKVSVDSTGYCFTTVIQNDTGEEVSSITNPSEMVWKK